MFMYATLGEEAKHSLMTWRRRGLFLLSGEGSDQLRNPEL
jgi:hypothetical protein